MHTYTIKYTSQSSDWSIDALRDLFPHVKLIDIAGAVPYLADFVGDECIPFYREAHTDNIVQGAYLYRHGCERIDTHRRCMWDSGKIGQIVIDAREWKILKGYKNMSPKRREEFAKEARDDLNEWQEQVEAIMNGWLYDIVDEDDMEFGSSVYGEMHAVIVKEIKYLQEQGHQLVDETGSFEDEVKS